MPNDETTCGPLSAAAMEIGDGWVWHLILGILFVLLGLTCVIGDVIATLVTVETFGWLLGIGGVSALIHGFGSKSSSGFLYLLLSALFRLTTGALLIFFPWAGAMGLTLMLVSVFIVSGLFRAIGAGIVKAPRWGLSFFSGFVSVALGVMLLGQMPASSIWFIGFALGLDLIVEGISMIGFASAIHRLLKLAAKESVSK